MAGNIEGKQGTHVTLQDGTSGSLSNGSAVAAATTFDNSSNLDFVAGIILNTGFSVAPAANVGIDLYAVPALDGSNYPDVDTSTPNLPLQCYVGTFSVNKSQTGAQKLPILGVPLMARLYKFYVVNKTGQTMSAGWTLDLYSDKEQYT